MSERNERIGRSVTKTFVEGVLTDRSKSDGQDRDLRENRREVFAQNAARRNWQDSCFSRGHHNSLMEVTATASSRTKIWSGEGQWLTRFPNKADKNTKKLSNATPNYSSNPPLIWELGLSAKANLRN